MTALLSPFDLDQRLIDLAERREAAFRQLAEIQSGTFVASERSIEELKSELPAEIERIDGELREYAQLSSRGERAAKLAQADKLRSWMRHLKTMQEAALEEAALMKKRAESFGSTLSWVKSLVGEFMMASETKKLEGAHGLIALRSNGGVEPLEIYDSSLIPDDLCDVTLTVQYSQFRQWIDLCRNDSRVKVSALVPSNTRIREALAKPCPQCMDHPMADCDACAGTGRASVPGVRLVARGQHVEVR